MTENERSMSEALVAAAEELRVLALALRAMERAAEPELLTGAAAIAEDIASSLMDAASTV